MCSSDLSDRIATLQSDLSADQYTSNQIQRVYDDRSRQRNHSCDAAVKHTAEWLRERTVDTVYIGDLTDVLETHWCTDVNEKTHAFWSHRHLVERVTLTFGDVGITVTEVNEAGTRSECPACSSANVTRENDSFQCHDCE